MYVVITTLNSPRSAHREEIQSSMDQMCQNSLKQMLQQAVR